jgi:hypothetical protein
MHPEATEFRAGAGRWIFGLITAFDDLQAVIGPCCDSISKNTALGARQDFCQKRVIYARGDGAIKGDLVHKGQESRLHVGHIAIAVHVFAVEIGYDSQNRREFQKGPVALVRFGYQVLRAAEASIRAQSIHATTHDYCRIEPSSGEHRGHHRSCRGFAVHACDSDTVLQSHEFSQHLCTLNYGNMTRARF